MRVFGICPAYQFCLLKADRTSRSMGTTAGDKALEVDYPLAFGNAFSKTLSDSKKKFRYIHLSGAATERDQEKDLWFKSEMRKMKVGLPFK